MMSVPAGSALVFAATGGKGEAARLVRAVGEAAGGGCELDVDVLADCRGRQGCHASVTPPPNKITALAIARVSHLLSGPPNAALLTGISGNAGWTLRLAGAGVVGAAATTPGGACSAR